MPGFSFMSLMIGCTLKTSNGEEEKSVKEYIFCKFCCFEEFCSFCTATAYIGQLER